MELVNISYVGEGKQPVELTPNDSQLVVSNFINSSFGADNDYMELFIYDQSGQLLDQDYDAFDYYPFLLNNPQNNTFSALTLDPEKDLKQRGFTRGNLNTQYNFYKKLFNSQFGTFYWIKEVSTSRTELKLASQVLSNDVIREGFNQYQAYISTKNYYPVFYLNFGNNQIVTANNVAYTEDEQGAYLLIKLYEPLPTQFDVKTQLWIIDKVAESVSFNVDIQVEVDTQQDINSLRGPNFNVRVNSKNGQTTPYYNYDNLLTSPVTSSFQKLLSYYQDKSVDINVDYSNFENFVHWSSAVERVNNFVYKVQLIESASADIVSQKTVVGGSTSQNIVSASILTIQNRIDNIIKNFDPYEYFLYFNSSSWAWPKSNSTQPYQLYSVSSSQATNFLGSPTTVPTAGTQSLLFSASYYDTTNKDILHGSAPQYLLDDPSNQPYITFLDMVGQHFDNIWIYYKDVTNRFNATNNPDNGISLDLVSDALRGFGFQLYTNSNVSDNLYYTLFGINPDGSLLPPTGSEMITNYVTSSLTTLPAQTIQDELYKRVYHNLPYLLKTKGTERGVKALIATYGIPDSILTVREFGGNPINALDGVIDIDSSDYKIQIATGSTGNINGGLALSSSLLSPYTTIQYYSNNNRVNNTNIEIGFSPADVINSNITSSQGYFDINQLIGNPQDQYSASYTPLVSASNAYFATYTQPNSVWEYIRLLKFYNNTLFKTIKDFVPARANVSTGIIVKSHLYERNKYPRNEPTVTFNDYSQSIDMLEVSGSDGGAIQGSTNWDGFVITPLGLASYTSSQNIEKYNGELDGSEIVVTNGEAFDQKEISSLPGTGSGFIQVPLGATYQNVSSSVKSVNLLDLDYSTDQIKPINYTAVTYSISASQVDNISTYTNPNNPYSQVQDYNYSIERSTIPRYAGSKTISTTYNTYTAGDSSYGKTAAIDKIKPYFAYLVDVYSSSFQLPYRSNAQIKYLIDNNENVLNLTKINQNIFSVQNLFKSGENTDVALFNYSNTNPYVQRLTNDSNLSIYEGGFRYSPILFNVSGTGSLTYSLLVPSSSVTTTSSPGEVVIFDGNANWWTFADSGLNLVLEGGTLYLEVTGSQVGGSPSGTSTLAVTVTLNIENDSTIADPAFYEIEFQIPAGTTAPYYRPKTEIPQDFSRWYPPDYLRVNGVSQQTYSPTGGSNITVTSYIENMTDAAPCWYAVDQYNVKLSISQSYWYNNFILSASYEGIDTPVFPFALQQMDLIRLYNTSSQWDIKSEYRVNKIVQDYTDSTGSFVLVTLDRPLNPADTKDGTIPGQICRYIVLKRLPDETNVILNYNLKQSITEDGILYPEYIDETLRENSGNIVKALTAQNLISAQGNIP